VPDEDPPGQPLPAGLLDRLHGGALLGRNDGHPFRPQPGGPPDHRPEITDHARSLSIAGRSRPPAISPRVRRGRPPRRAATRRESPG
jgi:hypothetical protein